MAERPAPHADNLRAGALMALGMALFGAEDTMIKAATGAMAPGMVLVLMGLGGGAILSIVVHLRGGRVFRRAALSRPIVLRNLCEMVGAAGIVMAISSVPLPMAASILQAIPLVVTLGAALFLGETVGWRRWSAIAVGLAGVLIILRPGTEGFVPGALWAVLAVVALAARDLITRRLAVEIDGISVAAWGFLSLIPAGLVLGPGAGFPGGADLLPVLGAILFGMSGYVAIVAATRQGEVAATAPFRYTRLVFSMSLAALFFGETPSGATLFGAALIVGSGLYTFWRERRLSLDPALR